MFTAAFSTTAKTWKQPKGPLTDKWIKKIRYIHTMEYYSSTERDEIGLFVETQMDLENVIQSEVRRRKQILHVTFDLSQKAKKQSNIVY